MIVPFWFADSLDAAIYLKLNRKIQLLDKVRSVLKFEMF